MNIHFMFFLLDIIAWLTIVVLFCSQVYMKKSYRVSLSKMTILSVLILSLSLGLFSLLIHGIPDIGFSMNSFAYAGIAPFGLIFYTQLRNTKLNLKFNKQK